MSIASFRRLTQVFLFLVASSSFAATSYIVELNGEPAAMAAALARAAGTALTAEQIEAHRASLAAKQDQLLDALRTKGIAFTVGGISIPDAANQLTRVDYRYTLVFNGINLLLAPSAVPLVESMPQVKKVHEDEVLPLALHTSVPYVRAPQVYGAVAELTRYDNAREGYEGQGMYLAIIDSGVSWHHEMFGGDPTPPRLGIEPDTAALGRNGKVVYYLPLADSAAEDGVGHGTHVAATAAGYRGFAPGADGLPLTADDIPMHGIAPQAKILSYKVCGDVGSITTTVGCVSTAITMAIEDAVSPRTLTGFPKPVAHVINMSLGGTGTPDSVTSVAADNAVRLGTTVVAAGGNSGPGDATVGSPCAGRLVTCVANSVDAGGSWSFDVLAATAVNPLLPGAVTPASSLPAANGQRGAVQLLAMSGSRTPPSQSLAQYFVFVEGGEHPASYPANVAGRIAIATGGLPSTFAQVANSAAAAGAIAVILQSETANPTAVKATIPAANLPPADFAYLKSLLSSQTHGALSRFPIRINPIYDRPTISLSSSRGPVAGYGQVKPDLSAPGTLITAAVPLTSMLGALDQSNYATISGTSMASPHVAGAAILVQQAHPTWTPDMIRTALMNTSTNLRDSNGSANADAGAERVLDQGAGLLDVHAAVNAKALLGVTSNDPNLPSLLGSHSFGEVAAINTRAITTRSVDVTIFDVSGNGGTYALSVADNRGLALPGVSVTLSQQSATLAPNASATFTVTVNVDGNQVATGQLFELQWYVRAKRNDTSEALQMPFYLRATATRPAAAIMNPVADDATPDAEGGIDRDGRFVLSWSYPANEPASPCGYRIEEARTGSAGTIYYDDAEQPLVGTSWTSRPHPGTLTLGYGAVYVDETTVSLETPDIPFPNGLVTLTFDSFEDTEPDFDYAYVDVTTDGGATWTTLAQWTGAFTGVRTIDLSPRAGHTARIRFRLVADQLISTPAHQGWSIDNIRVQAGASFHTLSTVPSSTTSLALGGKSDGTYAYRAVALFGNCASNPFATTPSNIAGVSVAIATRPPMAAFSSDANPSEAGQSVTFDASESSDQDSVGGTPGITQYHWSFGDGATSSTSAPTVSHAYATAGTYRVGLTVIDDDGESASTESLQTVTEASASVSAGGNVPVANGKANFSADNERVVWHDHARKLRVHSMRVTSVTRNGNRATITGECTVNKRDAATFVLELVDDGSADTATMTIGDYVAGGTITGGNVVIR